MSLAKKNLIINKNIKIKGNLNITLNIKFNNLEESINIVSGLGVEELCIVTKFINLYIFKNNKNDRDVIDKEFIHTKPADKVKELYKAFKKYVDTENIKKTLNKEEKEEIFNKIFKILLDMKRTGDHGMVKVVEELNKRDTDIKDVFLISGDKLCVTKALTKKVPCLLAGYDFENIDKKHLDSNILDKIMNLINKNNVDKILMFYKGISIETPLFEYTVPILKYFNFTDENLEKMQKNTQSNSDNLYKKIISFIIININKHIVENTNINIIFNNMQTPLNTLIENENGEIILDKSAIFYKLYIELIEQINNFSTNYYMNEYNTFIATTTKNIISIEKKNQQNKEIEIEKCNKFIKQVVNEMSKRKSGSSRILKQKTDSINEKTLRISVLTDEINESKNQMQPEYIYNSNKTKFIKSTKLQVNLLIKKFESTGFISTHTANIIKYIENSLNKLDNSLIYQNSIKKNSTKVSTE